MRHIYSVKYWMVLRCHVPAFLSTSKQSKKYALHASDRYTILNIRVSRVYKDSIIVDREAIEGTCRDWNPYIAVYDVDFNKFQKLQSHRRLAIVRSSCTCMTQSPEGIWLMLNAARYCLYSKCERSKHRFLYPYTFSFVSLFTFRLNS